MKNVFLIFFLIAVSMQVSAQESSINDNTIILQTNETFEEAYKSIGRLFVSNGLTIENANKDFGTITTEEFRMGSKWDPLWEMKITALISGAENATVILTATAKGPNRSWETLRKRGKLHMFSKGWETLETIARKHESISIEFEKR